MENEKIIQYLRSGNNEPALKQIYKSFPSIRNFITTHGGNQDDARDVFQESLLVFYKKVQQKDFLLTCSINTYLFSVVKYLWKDELKKKNRIVSFEVKEFLDLTENDAEEEFKLGLIDKVLENLGERCSEILQLFYYKKMSMDEIAQKFQYKNIDTVKTQKYKCIERAKIIAANVKFSFLNQEL